MRKQALKDCTKLYKSKIRMCTGVKNVNFFYCGNIMYFFVLIYTENYINNKSRKQNIFNTLNGVVLFANVITNVVTNVTTFVT